MIVYLISTAIAIAVLLLGEKMLPNETKKVYIEKGYDWNRVLIYSTVAGLVSGILSSVLIVVNSLPMELNPFFLPFATSVTAYITVQSLITDIRTLLINRYILRVAYISMYIISLYNVLTNELFKQNLLALIIFTTVLLLIFIFSSLGASDVRAIAVALPYVVSIGGYLGIEMLIATLLCVSLFMAIHRRIKSNRELKKYKITHKKMYEEMGEKEFNRVARKTIKWHFDNSDEHAVPVGPYMIMPFLIFLFIYPVLM